MNTKNFAVQQRFARSLRRTGATAIIHSGGRQTIFGCLCGSRHTASTDWNGRSALHVTNWQAEHEASCGSRFARVIVRRTDAWLESARASIYNLD